MDARRPLIELSCGGIPLAGCGIASAHIFQAVDRPDRLEARLIPLFPCAGGGLEPVPRTIAPGGNIEARIEGRPVFRGRVDRVSPGAGTDRGRFISVVAYASYHHLRRKLPPARYCHVTAAEVASLIAAELELVPAVEPTSRIHPVLERDGDPLRFLRRLARECGFQLAVSGGKLYFGGGVPPPGDRIAAAGGGAGAGGGGDGGLLSFEMTDRGRERGGRGGRLEAPGDPRWAPLARFDLGPGASFRAVRVIHGLDAGGYRSTVEFLESGLDAAAWEGDA